MRYTDAASFRQALEQRLKHAADGDGARLARNRKRAALALIAVVCVYLLTETYQNEMDDAAAPER